MIQQKITNSHFYVPAIQRTAIQAVAGNNTFLFIAFYYPFLVSIV